MGDTIVEIFDKIYSTDLVYFKDCWTLCGDAHCCNFSRYKSKFKLIMKTTFQELPLLPGEYEYLQHRGWLSQFGDFDYKVIEYPLAGRTIKVESIVSRRANCACNHDTRPTVCRLYPLLPVFDIDGRVTGTDSFGIYEELEQMEGLEPACKLTALPFAELQKFLTISSEIARYPKALYYTMAYRVAKKHICSQLTAGKDECPRDTFAAFERALIRDKLINHSDLKSRLASLAGKFQNHYGSRFELD